MGFVSKLIGRIPVFFVAMGLLLITGSYRGRGDFDTMPVIGTGLVLVGIVGFVALYAIRN